MNWATIPKVPDGYTVVFNKKETTRTVERKENKAPDSVIEKSNALVAALVGQDFFKKYVTFVSGHKPYTVCVGGEPCKEPTKDDHYSMDYKILVPEKDIAINFSLLLDDMGSLVQGQTIPLPDCVKNAQKCVFTVSKQQAIDIATKKGIEKDTDKEYETRFEWSESDKTFEWIVRGDITNSAHPCSKSELLYLDANTGKVLHQSTLEAACTNGTSVTN